MDIVSHHEAARGEFVIFHADGVLPTTDALAEFAAAITRHATADFVFADETLPEGKPWHKPGWSPALLLAQPYAANLFAVRRDVLTKVGPPRAECGAARLYDFAMRATAAARRVVHVPRSLCRSTRSEMPGHAHMRASAAAATACGLTATVALCSVAPVLSVSVRPRQRLPVTVIVPTRDRLDLLRPCVDSEIGRAHV